MPSLKILLINPNSSEKTTEMMVSIAQACADHSAQVIGVTAKHGPKMIITAEELVASEAEVIEIGTHKADGFDGIIVSAYGDPGLHELRAKIVIPVVGICEASMLEASQGGRRFGVATVTPDLADPIARNAQALNLQHLYSGIRLTSGDPIKLANNREGLVAELADSVCESLELDKAEAVIIGGGPLGQAAIDLAPMFDAPIIAPIPAAVRRLLALMNVAR